MSGHKEQDLVSIVIASYNHENYIADTIESVINQTYQNIELIIINDGSLDNTSVVIEAYLDKCKKRFFNLEYINQKNEGAVKAFNKGVKLAKGKYVSVCASDDTYEKDAIEILHDFLSKNNEYSLAVGDNYFIDDAGKRFYLNSTGDIVYNLEEATDKTFGNQLMNHKKKINFYSDDFGSYENLLIYGNHVPNGYLIRMSDFRQIGFYSEKAPLEDYYIMLQLSKISKLKYINKHLFNYRIHATNSSKQTEKMIKMTKETLLLEKDYAYKKGYKNIFNNILLDIKSRIGIPFILEIIKVKNNNNYEKYIKILGFKFIIKKK